MKKSILLLIISVVLFSCVRENRPSYKKNDLFGEFNSQQGFVILQLPPILFKIVLNSADDNDSSQKELLDKIKMIKVLLFEENEKSIKINELKNKFLEKINNKKYNLLTQITEEKSQISIFVMDEDENINELLFMIISDKELFCINCLGEFKKEDALKIYNSLNTEKLKVSKN